MKSLFIVLLLAISATAQITVSYKAGVNATLVNQKDYFNYRQTTTSSLAIPLLYTALYVSSLSVEVNPNSASVDGLFGSAYAGVLTPPSAYLAFFDVAAQWQGSANAVNASVTGSRGVIGQVFISLEEVPVAGGAAVQNILLGGLAWVGTDNSTGVGGLRHLTVKGVQAFGINPNFAVYVTYIIPDVVGVLNVPGSPIITPKSLESVIMIKNFPYRSTANAVRLNIGIGAAADTATVGIQGTKSSVVSGAGGGASYFTVDSTVQVDGQITNAKVSAFANRQTSASFGNPNLAGQIQAKYGAAAEFKIVSVTFPAGANEIVLDPQIGAGSPPPQVNAVDKMVPTLFIVMLAILKVFF